MYSFSAKTLDLSYAVRIAALALAYFAAAKASLVFAIPPGYATAIWPPSGIALAAMLSWGTRCWPGVWVGAALTNYSIELSVPAALGIATGNTLEGVCAAWLVAAFLERGAELRRPEGVFAFAVIAGVTSAIAATVGVTALFLAGAVSPEQTLANWYTWWQGDATGILIVAPCVLAWARPLRGGETQAGPVELAAFGALLIATLLAVFLQQPGQGTVWPIEFLVTAFFALAACRFGDRVVTLVVLLSSGFAVWCTVNGRGPFVYASLNESLLILQAFTSTGALLALVLRSLMRERGEALRVLRSAGESLQEEAHARSVELDGASARLVESEAQCSRLQGQVHDQAARMQALSRKLLDSQESERKRVAVALRDGVAQSLRALELELGALERAVGTQPWERRLVEESQALLKRALATIRGLVEELRPDALDDFGLLTSLEALAARFERRAGIRVVVVGGDGAALPPLVQASLFRIVQEALDNVERHAHAGSVRVRLDVSERETVLTIRDDGVGFDARAGAGGDGALGRGFALMREKIHSVHGRLKVDSRPGSGTIVTAQIG